MAEIADLLGLDRDVARAARGRSLEGPLRHVAGQSTYEKIGALEPAAHDVPLRDALRRWVYALTQRRIGRDLQDAEDEAKDEARGRYVGDAPRLVSWREAWRAIVASRARGEALPWLDAAVDTAPKIAAIERERASRRLEVARRMDLAHPSEPLAPAPIAKLHQAARDLLARTDDLAAHVLREAAPRDAARSIVEAILLATAKDAAEGWPPRLGPRWLDELFGAHTRGLSLDLPKLPPAVGASSFARALGSFGFALRVAMAPRGLPFAIAHDPWPVSAHRLSFVFGALPCSAQFHVAALGASRRVALAQARSLSRTALFEARLSAARLLLGDEAAFAPPHDFEELTARVMGASAPRALSGAWPAPREDEPARFAALVTAIDLARDLVDRFDTDWFRNPRAFPHLRAASSGPANERELALDPSKLAKAFEEALA